MAQQDYLSKAGGQFGTYAGSILSDRRSRKKKDAYTALAISAFIETLGAKNKQLDQELKDSLENVNENYKFIFEQNKDIYDLKQNDRDDYQSYLANKDVYLHNKAVGYFNSNRTLQEELGSLNPYGQVKKDDMTPESYARARAVYDSYLKQAEDEIIAKSKNPGVSIATYSEFKKPLRDEYIAAYNQVKNDPTKKGALRNWWNKAFGKDKEGNNRFGMLEVAELKAELDTAKAIRNARDEKVSPTLKDNEDKKINETITVNEEVNFIRAGSKQGIDVLLKNFNFQTKAEVIAQNKEALQVKVNKQGYTVNEDDILAAIEYGVNIPGFAGLTSIMNSDIKSVVSLAEKIQTIKKNDLEVNLWDEGVLSDRERALWSQVINQDLNARQASDINLRTNQIQLEKALEDAKDYKTVKIKDITEWYGEPIALKSLEASIDSFLEADQNALFKDIYNNRMSDDSVEGFKANVIQGALLLQQYNKGMSSNDAARRSMEIQLAGFYKFQDDPTRLMFPISDETHKHQYVNIEDLKLLTREVMATNDYEADTVVDLMNNKIYIQQMPMKGSKEGEELTLKPTTPRQSFIDGDYKFYVEQLTPVYGKPSVLRWNYKLIDKP
tara:strand:- start:4164 stop:5996 length:1833 start_codon:yes stop_codon:yes gene_type:complete